MVSAPPPNDLEAVSTATEPDTGGRSTSAAIALAALVLMFGNVLSRVLGLVREQLAASLFGTGDKIAAFTVADNLQTLIFDLMVSGALQAALVPVLAQWARAGDRDELRRVSGALVTRVALVLGALVSLGVFFAPHLVDGLIWFSGDDSARGEATIALAIRLVRIVLPAAALLGIGAILQAELYGLGRISAPALSTAVRNLAIVSSAAVFGSRYGVESMAWGTVAGAALVVLLQIGPLVRAGALPRPNFDFRHPALREMLRLYLPVFVGLVVSSFGVVVDRGLAWGAGEDAVGAMRYATTLVQLVLGLIAAAISLAALPTLSRHFSAADDAAFKHVLGRALSVVTILIFPATFGMAALARPIADLLFGHGTTDAHGVSQIAIALAGYLPGTLAAAYDQVLIFAFYSRRNTRVPVAIGVLAVGIYLVVALATVHHIGMIGLVAANSAQFIFHTAAIWWMARRHFGWTGAPRLRKLIPQCAAASLAMAGIALAIWFAGDRLVPASNDRLEHVARQLLLVGLPVTAAGVVYLLLVSRIATREVAELRAAVLGRLGRLARR